MGGMEVEGKGGDELMGVGGMGRGWGEGGEGGG